MCSIILMSLSFFHDDSWHSTRYTNKEFSMMSLNIIKKILRICIIISTKNIDIKKTFLSVIQNILYEIKIIKRCGKKYNLNTIIVSIVLLVSTII